MIVVFGAAGLCGAAVTRALVRAGMTVRGFVHREESRDLARQAGASQVLAGDLRRLDDVEAALAGTSGAFYVSPKFIADEAHIGRAVVAAAERAGVSKFVLQSALHSCDSRMLHHEAKREVEVALHGSDLEFTILQPARFVQNLRLSWKDILATGIYQEPFSCDSPVADVDYDDVAEVAALALSRDGYARAAFELCAEGMLNRHQRAAVLTEVLGRPIAAGSQSPEQWLASDAKARAMSPFEREARAMMFRHYDAFGFKGGNSFVLASLLGRRPTSYGDCVRRIAPKA